MPEDGKAGYISYRYSDYADVTFSYDRESGRYLKTAFGVPHTDAATGAQVGFDNVFVLIADVGIQEENGILMDFDLSRGEGYYFYKGMYQKITWQKGEPENPLLIYDEDGEILKVNPGKSYVGLLDNVQLPTFSISETAPETSDGGERVQ